MKTKVHIQKIKISSVAELSSLTVSAFKPAHPMDISFNPYRIIKSVLKQFYEIDIKEKRDVFNLRTYYNF